MSDVTAVNAKLVEAAKAAVKEIERWRRTGLPDVGKTLDVYELLVPALAAAEAAAPAPRVEGAWSLPKFFREEAPSFGYEADTEGMSPEQAAITLMRRLRRQLDEARATSPSPDNLEWLDEIEARAQKATPGPWRAIPQHVEEGPDAVRCAAGWLVTTTAGSNDSSFIAHARTDIPRLIKAIRSSVQKEGK